MYMYQLVNPIKVPMTETITTPTPAISQIKYVLIGSIIVFIFIEIPTECMSIVNFYQNVFDCQFEGKFGEPFSLLPKTII